MKDLSGRIAVVTGAGKGIGRAIVEKYLEENAAGVAILEMDGALAAATAAELDPTGEKVLGVPCDVSDFEGVQAAMAKVVEKFGRIDILVNNAGITRDAMFHKMSPAQFQLVVNVHLMGTYNCCQAVIPAMREQAYGRIINISSVNAIGNVGQTNYSAAKGAIEAFTRSLALESIRKNITVNAIGPGMIDTDMFRGIPEDIRLGRIKDHPAQRVAQPSEVANLAAFLASEDASWVTGNIIMCSGGQKLRT